MYTDVEYCEELEKLKNNHILIDYLYQTRQFIHIGLEKQITFRFMKLLTNYTEDENDGWGSLAKPTINPFPCQHYTPSEVE